MSSEYLVFQSEKLVFQSFVFSVIVESSFTTVTSRLSLSVCFNSVYEQPKGLNLSLVSWCNLYTTHCMILNCIMIEKLILLTMHFCNYSPSDMTYKIIDVE